jgi:hypothetical protein
MTDWTDGKDRFGDNSGWQIAVGTNQDGRLEIFYTGFHSQLYHNWQVSTADTTQWNGETRFPGNSARQITAVTNQDGRLEIFYVGTNGDLYHNWQAEPGGNWLGEVHYAGDSALQVVSAINNDGRLEICYIGTNNDLYHNFELTANGGFINHNLLGGQAAPPGMLGSSSNYLITNCGFLTDVAVTIFITQDLYCKAAGSPASGSEPAKIKTSNHGFTWQLNCYSPDNQWVSWQQYGIQMSSPGNDLDGFANNWFTPAPTPKDYDINQTFHLTGINKKIPAGYQLQIILLNDENANITGVACRVIDDHGNLAGSGSLKLTDNGIKEKDLSPIVAFELVLVGEYNGNVSEFASGAGMIVYAASTLMTAENTPSGCIQAKGTGTAETSNSTYGLVSASPSNVLVQSFDTASPEVLRLDPSKFNLLKRPPVL